MSSDTATPATTTSTEPEDQLVPVAELTDEELAAIDPVPDEERLVVYPWLDSLPADQRETAVVTAFRGLAARGLVDPPSGDEPTGDGSASVEIGLSTGIATALGLRQAARRAVVAQRTSTLGDDYLYLYDCADDAALAEFVERKGLHRFAVLAPGSVLEALMDFVVPLDWVGSDGPDLVAHGDDADPALVEALSAAHVQVEITVRTPGPAPDDLELIAVSAGPQGILATARGATQEGPVVFRQLTAPALRAWLGERLA